MHISEGVLSAPVLIGGGALTAVGTAIGLKSLDYDRIMMVAILTSSFFIASLIHVPAGPASVHLVLNGLLGLLLGWACFPAILVALLLQAVFFQFGGITVIGVNTLNMAASALLSYYLVKPWLARQKTRAIAGFVGGFLAILLAALMMAASLGLTDQGYIKAAMISIGVHLPVMVIEGFVTMFAVSFIGRVHPDILEGIKK
ncbi:cobalt transporter CbiM [Desulfopila sp. IMCC35008]|uniref:cobalt transporter CbiM n=1 Tax=Desulfopila sp. IMCC35008 TaxID=2653858 RepID=UPI0013D432A3|nr:cobalt transporter CbiM [Desulfopila sp. IMCC35008]